MAWYDNDEKVRDWIRTKFSYEASTGVISDRASGVEVGGINSRTGYRFIGLFETSIKLRATAYAHRLAWFLHYGEWPSKDLDHKNRVRTDNRIENLRECTQLENTRNRAKQPAYGDRTCRSTHKGVTWHKRRQRWMARIQVEGRRIHLGEFDSEEVAAEAYRAAAAYHFGEFAGHASVGA